MLKTGQVLNNRYQIQATLGSGGFGAVYKVWDDNLQRFCAIKENLQASDESQKQFKREAIMLASLNHPHLVRVTDYFFISNQGQYLVMDYVEGDNLETILTNNKGPLPSEQALAWIRQICDALIYIHNQNPPIIHRDIKPANIRITPQKNAVLVDFGLAKTFDISAKTTMGARGLTPHFAAPEQYGMGGTDAQSDIYSLGVTLYCMLTYRVPPDSVEIMVGNANPPLPAKAISRNIPDSVSDALLHAMQIRRTERYKSVSDFKTALFAEQKPFAQAKVVEPPAIPASNFANNKLILSNGMEFMRVPAGKFLMGSDNSDSNNEQPQHTVDILHDYWMARFPVTNELYNAYAKAKGIKHPVGGWEKKIDHPVGGVSWIDTTEYCKWLSNLFKSEIPSSLAFRLPTEAEWEKAARGIDGREYPWGNTFDKNKCNSVNEEDRAKGKTTSVGLYSPRGDSPYGCADMAGNVWEWVNDWYGEKYYRRSLSSNPLGPESGTLRVLRGGSGYDDEYGVRSAFRLRFDPCDPSSNFGFRVLLAPIIEENKSIVEMPKPIQVVTPKNVISTSNNLTLSNGMEFMRVPAGKFLMGSDKVDDVEEEDDDVVDQRPQHTVEIPYDYWIARFPVTNELYDAYVKAKGIIHPVDGWKNRKDHPVTEVSQIDAIDYSQWLNNLLKAELPSGLILCLSTEAEWEKSARGIDGREYPWGNEFGKNKCNTGEGGKGGTTVVGLYSPHGDSPYGCADMVGNVFEWTNSLKKEYPYNVNDGREIEKTSGDRVIRGGCFRSAVAYACCTYRDGEEFKGSSDAIGFRVVLSPIKEKKTLIEALKSIQFGTPKNVTQTPSKFVLSNGMEFMRVPAGKFLMGSDNDRNKKYNRDNESPQHAVDIPYDYWMSRFPVTNELYNVFAKAKGIVHPIDSWAEEKDHPIVMVNWNDAMGYCKWLNNLFKNELLSGMIIRLPTEAEWEKAARGTDGREYPWGNIFDKNKCNSYDKKVTKVTVTGIYTTGSDGETRAMLENGKGGTTPIGLYSPLGDSLYGCADMSGNVLEWTHSENKAYPYNVKDGRENEQLSISRVLRGGSFGNDDWGMCCAYRFGHYPDSTNGDIGFRVVVSCVISDLL